MDQHSLVPLQYYLGSKVQFGAMETDKAKHLWEKNVTEDRGDFCVSQQEVDNLRAFMYESEQHIVSGDIKLDFEATRSHFLLLKL